MTRKSSLSAHQPYINGQLAERYIIHRYIMHWYIIHKKVFWIYFHETPLHEGYFSTTTTTNFYARFTDGRTSPATTTSSDARTAASSTSIAEMPNARRSCESFTEFKQDLQPVSTWLLSCIPLAFELLFSSNGQYSHTPPFFWPQHGISTKEMHAIFQGDGAENYEDVNIGEGEQPPAWWEKHKNEFAILSLLGWVVWLILTHNVSRIFESLLQILYANMAFSSLHIAWYT